MNILHKRGKTSAVNAYTGPAGELVVNTDENTILVQDGKTAGGTVLAKYNDVTNRINRQGARGQLNGYETQTPSSGATATIGYLTGDCVVHNAINQTALTVTVDGGGISDIGSSCGVKILFIYNTMSLTSLSITGANGITNIDWEGENPPSFDGKQVIQIVFFLHDISASITLKQWSQ